ncbi:DUF4244 domain-containing protein [Luteococcus peritonei]|uniref:DUF4244 domain-containing protein n=1 Tax=Luteococcus peritonei TaxID=88874 RepID=A0ABW4RUP8_9ACTN
MSVTHTTTEVALPLQSPRPAPRPAVATLRRWGQRGMVTAEYAVGILAAIAFALVLLKVFNDNEVFTVLLKQVTALIGTMGKNI